MAATHSQPRPVAIVTGAGSGIGRGVARALAETGTVVTCADLSRSAAEATAADIGAAGGTAIAAEIDVCDRIAVGLLVSETANEFGRLDVMCNIAGIATTSLVVDTTEEELDRTFAVNVKGVFFGCQAAARVMLQQGYGSIVNMASTAIDTPAAALACYALSKAAVAQLTKTLALEVGRSGVRVNAVAPGFVATPMTLGTKGVVERTDEGPSRRMRAMAEATAMGRLTEIDDVARVVVFLASDAAAAVTGQTLRVNAGSSMPW